MKFFRKVYLALIAALIIVTQNAFVETKAEEISEIHEIALGESFRASYNFAERIIYSYTAEESGVYYLTPDDVHDGYESILIQCFADPYDSDSFISEESVYYDFTADRYLCYTGGHPLLFEEGKTYYFELAGVNPELSSYEMILTLAKRPFSIDSVTVESLTRYIGDENYCHVIVADYEGEGEYYEPGADEVVEPSITAVLDGNTFSGLLYEVERQIYDAYGYHAFIGYLPDHVVFEEYEVEFTQEVLAPIESVSVDDYVVVYSESAIDNFMVEYTLYNENTGEDERVPFYSVIFGVYGDPSLTVVAEGKTYSGTLTEVREQLHEVYGVWFSLNVLPVRERFEAGSNSLECYFGGIKTTMNVIFRDDIKVIEAPVVKMVFRIHEEPISTPELTLAWNSVDIGARAMIRYYVYRSEESALKASRRTPYTLIAVTYKTLFTDHNVTAGKNYYYTVKAVCLETGLSSPSSNVVSFRPLIKPEQPIKK